MTMPNQDRPTRRADFEMLFLEIAKVLQEMAVDARNHGFDVAPYLDKLANLSHVIDKPGAQARLQ